MKVVEYLIGHPGNGYAFGGQFLDTSDYDVFPPILREKYIFPNQMAMVVCRGTAIEPVVWAIYQEEGEF